MADLVAALNPLPTPPRARRVSFKLRIENKGEASVHLTRIDPLVGEGIKAPEAFDLDLFHKQTELDEELRRLTRLHQDYEIVRSGAIRDQITRAYAEMFTEALTTATGAARIGSLPRTLLRLGSGRVGDALSNAVMRAETYLYEVEDVVDARRLLDASFDEDGGDAAALRQAYERVLRKAERMHAELPDWSTFATVPPGGAFETHFDVSFGRGLFEPRTRTFSVRTGFVEDTSRETTVAPSFVHASATHTISPDPWMLSVLTVAWAFLGLLLGAAMDVATDDASDSPVPTASEVLASVGGAEWIAAPLLALIVFNVYENLDLGQRIQLPASWRSALLIGALCGLFGERILESLQVLMGA
ncbi:hypothetical protein [Rubrivirga sp.]|uniref:hypothetical protein n=1 Tax=Rubrivirga sp. TaxID=1885344 RepID=UPI003B526CFE